MSFRFLTLPLDVPLWNLTPFSVNLCSGLESVIGFGINLVLLITISKNYLLKPIVVLLPHYYFHFVCNPHNLQQVILPGKLAIHSCSISTVIQHSFDHFSQVLIVLVLFCIKYCDVMRDIVHLVLLIPSVVFDLNCIFYEQFI